MLFIDAGLGFKGSTLDLKAETIHFVPYQVILWSVGLSCDLLKVISWDQAMAVATLFHPILARKFQVLSL